MSSKQEKAAAQMSQYRAEAAPASNSTNELPDPVKYLNNGVAMPRVGFGVFKVANEDVEGAVEIALSLGYRSIDTAKVYGNEAGVGRAIADSGLDRTELFVTSKVWNADQGYQSALDAYEQSLEKLGLEYLDLYLIHWPAPALGRFVDTWHALERLYADGRVRSIGVSNFGVGHLTKLIAESDVVPAINQVELHPLFHQEELRLFHATKGIATEAWAPLARGKIIENEGIEAIAGKHGKSPAQVVLRWHIQLGNVVIPKSTTPERIRENFEIFDFQLTQSEVDMISSEHLGVRVGSDPDSMNVV
jgi:2,5-diketo-D-gluconate reductase A